MKSTHKILLNAGKILIHENDSSRKLYILRKGKVRVYKNYMGGKISLAILGPGEIFGELSFFDAKPRSATVEAITDIVVDCIDGEQLSQEIDALPVWVHTVFKSVATRFRKIDQQMTVYQSLSNFQRKTLATDAIGSTIYSDLLRITKIFKMVLHEKGNPQVKKNLIDEVNESIGKSYITFKGYLRVLDNHDFFELKESQNDLMIEIDEKNLIEFESFLKAQYEQNRCIILSAHALGFMRRALSLIDEEKTSSQSSNSMKISKNSLEIQPEEDDKVDALKSLIRLNIFSNSNDEYITIDIDNLIKQFKYHSIIKSFDHTIVYED